MRAAVRPRSPGKVPQASEFHCCKVRQGQGRPHETYEEYVSLWVLLKYSRVPLVNRDVVVVLILDHRHTADRCVERFHDERHGPLLHLVEKRIEV